MEWLKERPDAERNESIHLAKREAERYSMPLRCFRTRICLEILDAVVAGSLELACGNDAMIKASKPSLNSLPIPVQASPFLAQCKLPTLLPAPFQITVYARSIHNVASHAFGRWVQIYEPKHSLVRSRVIIQSVTPITIYVYMDIHIYIQRMMESREPGD